MVVIVDHGVAVVVVVGNVVVVAVHADDGAVEVEVVCRAATRVVCVVVEHVVRMVVVVRVEECPHARRRVAAHKDVVPVRLVEDTRIEELRRRVVPAGQRVEQRWEAVDDVGVAPGEHVTLHALHGVHDLLGAGERREL
ncbi:MAG: hypothetical protein CL862_01810 [Cyanobium sp. NAT70]|nr:hypothetical protein [Cyanobium sp. NAT70]